MLLVISTAGKILINNKNPMEPVQTLQTIVLDNKTGF